MFLSDEMAKREIDSEEIVLDDLLVISAGDQVVVDGDVIQSNSLEIDESLTGESDAIVKETTDELLSGSFVNAGSGTYQAKRIGADSYANTLAMEAKRF